MTTPRTQEDVQVAARRQPNDGLSFVVTGSNDRQTIHAHGELSHESTQRLRALMRRLTGAGCRDVTLDLAHVVAADLDGLQALAELSPAVTRDGATFAITNPDLAVYPIDWHVVPHSSDALRATSNANLQNRRKQL